MRRSGDRVGDAVYAYHFAHLYLFLVGGVCQGGEGVGQPAFAHGGPALAVDISKGRGGVGSGDAVHLGYKLYPDYGVMQGDGLAVYALYGDCLRLACGGAGADKAHQEGDEDDEEDAQGNAGEHFVAPHVVDTLFMASVGQAVEQAQDAVLAVVLLGNWPLGESSPAVSVRLHVFFSYELRVTRYEF